MRKVSCLALLVGLMVSPALAATVTAGFNPQDTYVGYNQTFWVLIQADIDPSTPIVGFGIDLDVVDPAIAAPTGNLDFSVGVFDQGYAPDGDGLVGLYLDGGYGISGLQPLVAVEFQSFGLYGMTPIMLSDDYPTDLTEGFPVAPPPSGVFAEVEYIAGAIYVPEPGTLCLLALGGLALLRRR